MDELSIPVSRPRGALRRAGWALITGLVAAVAAGPAAADAQPKPADCTLTVSEPWHAVRYTEWPEGGPSRAHGRPLPQSSRPTYGIDINSWVRIDIDADALWCRVKEFLSASPEMDALVARIELLTGAQASFKKALDTEAARLTAMKDSLLPVLSSQLSSLRGEITAPSDAGTPGQRKRRQATVDAQRDTLSRDLASAAQSLQELAPARPALRESADLLERALELRTGAKEMAIELRYAPVMALTNDDLAENTRGVRQLGETLARETILALEEVHRLLQQEGVVLRIEAKLFTADGASSDLRLFPYNDAAAGVSARDDKTSVPVAANPGTTMMQTKAEGLKNSAAATATRAMELEGPRQEVSDLLKRTTRELEGLLADPPDATRREVAGTLGTLSTAMDPDKAPSAALGKAGEAQQAVAQVTLIPRPLGRDLDTAFRLVTHPKTRKAGDVVRIQYAVGRLVPPPAEPGKPAAEPVFKSAELDWEDALELRSFGWHNHFVGGIAFVQQDGESSWKPAPVASWVVDFKLWPQRLCKQGNPSLLTANCGSSEAEATTHDAIWTATNPIADPGLRDLPEHDWFSGGGLSLLAVDFDPDKDFEVGLAATLSFFRRRLQVGYGYNLNADRRMVDDMEVDLERGFWFFTVNLFDFNEGGMIFKKVKDRAK